MAGSGYGVTPMSRLSHTDTSRRGHAPRPKPGKPLELSSSNGTAINKKKGRKRKTLSSRYTADAPPKRRKLGIGVVKEPLQGNNQEEQKAEQLNNTLDNAGTLKARSKGKLKSRVKARTYRLRRAVADASSNTLDIKINSTAEFLSPCKLDHNLDESKVVTKAGSPNQEILNSKLSLKSGISGHAIGRCDSQVGALNLSEPARTVPDVDGKADRVLNSESLIRENTEGSSLSLESKQAGVRKRHVVKLRAAELEKNTLDTLTPAGGTLVSCRKPSPKEFSVCAPSDPVVRIAGINEAAYPVKERYSPAVSPARETKERHDTSLEGRLLRPRKHSRKESEDRLPPGDYVGKRVVVYWPHAKAWFAGKVMTYDDTTKKHDIKYDDGDEESILFRRHKVVLERQQPLSQSVVDPFPTSRRVSFTKAVVDHSTGKGLDGTHKPVHQAESGVKDDGVLEDSAFLSDVARRHGLKGVSVRSVGALKRVDAFVNKDMGTSPAQMNIGESQVGNGNGDKAGRVYVRRAKTRQKVEGSSNNVAAHRTCMDENSRLGDGSNGVSGQDMQRKRKKSKFLLRQADENDPPPSSLNLKTPGIGGEIEGDLSPREPAPQKRNKRSFSRLIGKAGRRPGRKRGRKHKLADLILSTSDNSVPKTKREGARNDTASAPVEILVHFDVPEVHTREQLSEDAVSRHTLYLLVPVVSPSLFSWQMFNILAGVKLCDGGAFDGRFCLNGSHQDWLLVFQMALCIIKAMPLSAWGNQRCGRLWQCQILYEFWVSLSGRGPRPHTDFIGHFPTAAVNFMVDFLHSAHASRTLSSRQALNLLVCYFLKPFVVATASEKGVPLRIGAQQFLLLQRSKCQETVWARQSVESFSLQMGSESGDSAFLSYLALFPRPNDWSSEEGLFVKQMEDWIASARDAGHAKRIAPVPSVKPLNHLGWQVTSTYISIIDGARKAAQGKLCDLGQGCAAALNVLKEFVPHCVWPEEAPNMAFHGGSDRLIRLGCLCKALLCVSTLHEALFQAVKRNVPCVNVSSRFGKVGSLSQTAPLRGAPGNAPPDLMTSSGKREMPNVKGAIVVTPGSDAVPRYVKVEPDATLSRRNSSITTESNGAAVKEESSVDMYSWQHEQTHDVGINGPQERSGLQVVGLEQPNSHQIDKEYYAPKRSKDTKKVKKHRPHHQIERPHVWKETPSFCFADVVVTEDGTISKEQCARVELQANSNGELILMARCDGKVYEQKVVQGSSFSKSAGPDPRWESGNGWALEFPDKQQWKLFRCMYNNSTARAMAKEIPIPSARPVTEYHELMSPAPRSPHAIRYYSDDEVEVALKHGRVLYDLDTEDEAWLHKTNNIEGNVDGDSAAWLVISDDVLERMIDMLEKEAFRKGSKLMDVQEAVELCRDLGVADNVVRLVHCHWLNKRHAKGKALLRYFQPPLWEQYQRDLSKWEAMMESCTPNMQSQLLKQHPRPVMSAFCLQSRSLDVSNRSKRVLRQRSQRKIKPSVSSSEESQRVPAVRIADSGLQSAHGSWHRVASAVQELPESVKVAQATAVEARRVAIGKAAKSQKRFLEFDSALQRAWALLMEYEVATGGHPSVHDEVLEARMARLFNRCSSFLRKGENPTDDEGHSGPGRVGEEFLQAFSRKCSIEGQQQEASNALEKGGQPGACQDVVIEEASPLLPISMKDPSYAWNGSSLL